MENLVGKLIKAGEVEKFINSKESLSKQEIIDCLTAISIRFRVDAMNNISKRGHFYDLGYSEGIKRAIEIVNHLN